MHPHAPTIPLTLRWFAIADKESANCRLEAQYAMQQQKEMVPILLEEGYKPTGWLGMLLGVRLWYGFFGSVLASETAFNQKISELCRELETVTLAAALSTPPLLPPQTGVGGAAEGGYAERYKMTRAVVEGVPPSPSLVAASPHADPRSPATQMMTISSAAAVSTHHDATALFWQGELQELRTENQQLRQSLQSLQGQLGTLKCLMADELAALQCRLRQLRESELLTAQEAAALQDNIADFVVAEPCLLGQFCVPGAVHMMARLSEAFAEDGDFARQLRRKCV